MSQPIDVYFWPTPNGHKITIALEEMGLAYAIKPVDIGRGDQFGADFEKLSPNHKMPAIVDHDGPDAKPVSVFESGAILQYLGRKTGQFYGAGERGRVAVEEWLTWQVAGFGPLSGQANHFRNYAPMMIADQRMLAYGVNRYSNEVHRLFGVLDTRLRDRQFVAGDYSIADMAIWPWANAPKGRGIDLAEFPAVKAWAERVGARDAVRRALAAGARVKSDRQDLADVGKDADEARRLLFGQRARR